MSDSHHHGNFGVYFHNKLRKLNGQDANAYTQKSTIFKDCVFYITGTTDPSPLVLKRLIIEHGGSICSYFGKKSASTHVIAAYLTNQKIKDLKHHKVVKPEFITACIERNALLNWSSYKTIPENSSSMLNFGVKDLNSAELETKELDEDVSQHQPSGSIDTEWTTEKQIEWIHSIRKSVNCLDPNFISDYFRKSRLHFMSTRKLDLKMRCRQYKPPSNFVSQPGKVLMHVDYDCFFVSASLKKAPELTSKPVCVSNGSSGSDIASCNYVAREYGVKNGMWVGKAKEMCPSLVCLPFDFDEYAKCSDLLYDALLALNPTKIAAISLDEAIVDISNLDTPVHEICTAVKLKIKQTAGIDASIGIGPNILLAKLALRKAKPNGQAVFNSASDIQMFKVRDLPGVGRSAAGKLSEIGVETISDIQTVTVSKLINAVGNALGKKLLDYSNGKDVDDIQTLDPPIKTIGIEIGWAVRVITEEEKTAFLRLCCQELFSRVSADVNCDMLTIKQYKRTPGTSFIASKHLGHGLCNIVTKTTKMNAKFTLNELIDSVLMLSDGIACPPLDFRGVGLHLKVNSAVSTRVHIDKNQTSLSFSVKPTNGPDRIPVSNAEFEPKTPPKQVRPAVPYKAPKLHSGFRKEKSVARYFKGESNEYDLDVLAELPTQIRKEFLLHEDDYEQSSPSYISLFMESEFYGRSSLSSLRKLTRNWIQTTKSPTNEDARAFFQFIKLSSSDDTCWNTAFKLVEWMGLLIKHKKEEDWTYFYKVINDEMQKQLIEKFNPPKLFSK